MRIKHLLPFLLFFLLWATASSASAHAVHISSSPAPNQILQESPEDIEIEFSEPVVPQFSRILLLSQAGQRVDVGNIEIVNTFGTIIRVTIPEPLDTGSYIVSWQVLSTVDGHTTSGVFSFGVGVTEVATSGVSESTATQPTIFSAGGRWFNLIAISLLLGMFVFRLFIWNPTFKIDDTTKEEKAIDQRFGSWGVTMGLIGVAVLALSLIFTFIAQSQQLGFADMSMFEFWLGTQFGKMWLARLLIGVGLLNLLLLMRGSINKNKRGLKRWTWWAGLALSVGLAIATALVSHSAALTRDTWQAVSIDLLHVLSAGIWAGGLLQFILGLWVARTLDNEGKVWLSLTLILNFSALAAVATGILIVTGSYLSAQHIGSWIALVGTAYGQTLMWKVGGALLAFGIAGINLLIIKPRLNTAYDNPDTPTAAQTQRRFANLLRLEAIFALLILIAAGYLTDQQRAKEAPLTSDNNGVLNLTAPADNLNVAVNVTPAQVGENNYQVTVTDENGDPVTDTELVRMKFTFLGQSIGSATTDMLTDGDGVYYADTSNISLVGPWQLEITVRREGEFDAFAPFRLEAVAGGGIVAEESANNRLTEWATALTRTAGLVPGTAMVLFALFWGFIANRAADKAWQLIPLLVISLVAFWFGAQRLLEFYEDYTPTMFANNPHIPDSDSIAEGRAIYETNCLACHGTIGRGDGPAAANLYPPPVDFGAGHTETHPDGDLWYWVKTGVEGTAMPAFGDKLTDDEMWHTINYIRRLSAGGTR